MVRTSQRQCKLKLKNSASCPTITCSTKAQFRLKNSSSRKDEPWINRSCSSPWKLSYCTTFTMSTYSGRCQGSINSNDWPHGQPTRSSAHRPAPKKLQLEDDLHSRLLVGLIGKCSSNLITNILLWGWHHVIFSCRRTFADPYYLCLETVCTCGVTISRVRTGQHQKTLPMRQEWSMSLPVSSSYVKTFLVNSRESRAIIQATL